MVFIQSMIARLHAGKGRWTVLSLDWKNTNRLVRRGGESGERGRRESRTEIGGGQKKYLTEGGWHREQQTAVSHR